MLSTQPFTRLNNLLNHIFCPFFLLTVLFLNTACQSPPPPASVKESPTSVAVADAEFEGKDTAYFVDSIADLSRWARSRPFEYSIMRSSHNQKDGTEDADTFHPNKYTMNDREWQILIDEKGPGCVTRLWLSETSKGRLRFYFDHEQEPRIDITVQELFTGWHKQSVSMLVNSVTDTSCGQVSLFPFPFAKHCTIMTDATEPGFKYQVNILKLPSSDNVISYSKVPDQRLKDALSRTDAFMKTVAFERFMNQDSMKASVTLEPDAPQLIANLPGPAAIDYLEFKIPGLSMDVLNNIDMTIYWDGMNSPTVQCTLREFFCNIDCERNWFSLPLGYIHKLNTLYSQFYMPFKDKAQIFLNNRNSKPIKMELKYHVDIDMDKITDDPLYLYVRSDQRPFLNGNIYPLIEFQGSGNFVGLNMLTYSDPMKEPFFILEGDEYIYTDGQPIPFWSGTGMDNYFNAENRLATTRFFMFPTHGCTSKVVLAEENGAYRTGFNMYRFHLLDDIPFRSSIMMVQEIGCPVKFNASEFEVGSRTMCHWTCFWYGKTPQENVPRSENMFYYDVSKSEKGAPTLNSPIMLGSKLFLRVDPGEWWIHFAPVWDISKVQHIKQDIK
jgi:D-arabinan exo alpha-(1,3)/(1,5)-arabinofuranosidase (non-reducing end)